MNREFMNAIDELVKEKEISKEVLLDAIEAALSSAYKKHYGSSNNVRVDINRETGDISVYMRRTVVETLDEIESETSEIHIEDAKEIDEKYEAGDIVETVVKPRDFGRIAAQTAKQVVVQKIREAERDLVYSDYINKVSEIAVGVVQRVSNDTVYVNLGKTEGILAYTEQVEGEKYTVNSRIKVYIMDVRNTTKGPQIFLSRSHPGFVKRLFELEVPEIYDGIVEIKSISREAGSRTKMAVYTANDNVDAVGACVGTRGSRVQAVVDEIFGEKIDIILWDEDPEVLISSALSPAKTEQVIIYEEEKMAVAVVPDHQLSLAIGKEGQNVRLAARLTGWKIDIKSHSKFEDSLYYEEDYDYDDEDYYYDEEEVQEE
ncbi:MAG: transcription termination/antitermination protein NusA [Firmicutes bacterium]|nr:transcription termination/antitermination protein NusA [Bacillota bacterium]MBR6701087.1 transcription termination/antitermination protein NusA [Bacillota bacterium]